MPTFNGRAMTHEAHKIASKVLAVTGKQTLPATYPVAKQARSLLRKLYSATGGKRSNDGRPQPTSQDLRNIYNGKFSGAEVYASLLGRTPTKAAPDLAPEQPAPYFPPLPETTTGYVVAPAKSDEERKLEALRDLLGPKIDPAAVEEIVDRRVGVHMSDVLTKTTTSLATMVTDEVAKSVRTIQVSVNQAPPVTIANPHMMFDRVMRYVANRKNVMLVGPTGSGKTTCARMVAKALNLDFYMNGAVSDSTEFLGYRDAGGTYRSTEFRKAWEFGGVFCADELDGCAPEAALSVNAHFASIIGETANFPDAMVPRHDDCVIIANGNTWGRGADRHYVGRNQLDAATTNRFAFLNFGYDEGLERLIACNQAWTERVQKIRAAVFKLGEKVIVSPRASIDGGLMLAAGETWDECEDAYIWQGTDVNVKNKILAEIR